MERLVGATDRDSSLRLSACEYAAPTTRPEPRPGVFVGSRSRSRWLGALQKGEVELRRSELARRLRDDGAGRGVCGETYSERSGDRVRSSQQRTETVNPLVGFARVGDAWAVHLPTWTISFGSWLALGGRRSVARPALTCCCGFLPLPELENMVK